MINLYRHLRGFKTVESAGNFGLADRPTERQSSGPLRKRLGGRFVAHASNAGAVYVYSGVGGGWGEVQKLTASDGELEARFW